MFNSERGKAKQTKQPGLLWAFALFISYLLQALGAVQLAVHEPEEQLMARWLAQVGLIIFISILLSIGIGLSRRYTFRTLMLSLKVFHLSAILVLIPGAYGIRLSFLISLCVEISIFLSVPISLIFAFSAAVMMGGLQVAIYRWDMSIPRERLIDSLFIILISVISVTIGVLAQAYAKRYRGLKESVSNLRESIQRLTDATSGFHEYLRAAEEDSRASERNRIIHEIHDSIGFTLTTIIMLSEAGLEKCKKEADNQFNQLFQTVRDSAKQGLTDVRVALRVLKARKDRISDLHHLLRLVRAFEAATNVRVMCNYGNIPFWFEEQARNIIFRVIQESMVNALRHGNATVIEVSMWMQEGSYNISIEDNGRGCSDLVEGIGLSGIRERIEATGGSLSLRSGSSGFTLNAIVPIGTSKESMKAIMLD